MVMRWRETTRSTLKRETWRSLEGARAGFESGTDDVTAVALVGDYVAKPGLLVGRASGLLHLVSAGKDDFGRMFASFEPSPGDRDVQQREIQHFDIDSKGTVAAVTKKSIILYSLSDAESGSAWQTSTAVRPASVFNIRDISDATPFRHLRQAKFMENGDLAFCMTSSTDSVRVLSQTPSGVVLTNACKLGPSSRCPETLIYKPTHPQNARALLPVDMRAVPGGNGNAILSSYDDGTIRLQDVRTPAAYDSIYQDHFEVVAPMGPLLAYGMERFIAGSARSPTIKIFDYRWTKAYSYTDALPCNEQPMIPKPKSLTLTPSPTVPNRSRCDHLLNLPCNLHALARSDFLRPSCSVYLSVPEYKSSATPIYSLAKSSSLATTVYAGLTGELIRMSLIDREAQLTERLCMDRMVKEDRAGYEYTESLTSFVETGDGLALSDISKTSRLPALFKQKPNYLANREIRPWQRLDESLV